VADPRPSAFHPRLAGLVLFLSAAASAQDLGIKAPPQAGPIAIVNVTVHPVSGPVIEHGYIAFDRGLITAVGSGPYTQTGPGTVVDATGRHVWPGLIGADTRLGISEIDLERSTLDYNEVGAITPEVRAAVAVNPDSTNIPVTRSNGVLTVGVFPTGGLIPGRVSVIRMDGWTWEDMAVAQDAGLEVNWPYMGIVSAWWMDKSEDEQRKGIRERIDAIDRAFSQTEAYKKAKAADPSGPTDIRWEAMAGVLPGAEKQRPLFINAQDVDQIMAAVTWAVGRGLKPVIVGGRDAELCADLLKANDVPVLIQGTHTFPKRADSPYDDAYTLPARLAAAGVRFCLATADTTPHERNLPYNVAMAVAYGLDMDLAVRSITLSAAEVLGVADSLGSLENGKAATLIVTDGNPLEVTTHVERAFIDGREIDLTNKQTRLAAKYREKYRQQEEAGNRGQGTGKTEEDKAADDR
jgi:imidazolonepropionase-like amidohydrolase